MVGKSLYFNQLKLDHGTSETKCDIFCFVLLCLILMLVVVWLWDGVYVCDACEHMPVCAYMYTNEGRQRESSVFHSCPLPYCLESWTVAQAIALQLGHTGWPLCYNYLPVFTQSCQGYNICSHAWLFYVDVRDLNSQTHDCTASTLSPWAISPGLVLSVYKEDTYMVRRMPL